MEATLSKRAEELAKELACSATTVNWRFKQYRSLALQTVPYSLVTPSSVSLVLFAILFFGRRPGWRFGTV